MLLLREVGGRSLLWEECEGLWEWEGLWPADERGFRVSWRGSVIDLPSLRGPSSLSRVCLLTEPSPESAPHEYSLLGITGLSCSARFSSLAGGGGSSMASLGGSGSASWVEVGSSSETEDWLSRGVKAGVLPESVLEWPFPLASGGVKERRGAGSGTWFCG